MTLYRPFSVAALTALAIVCSCSSDDELSPPPGGNAGEGAVGGRSGGAGGTPGVAGTTSGGAAGGDDGVGHLGGLGGANDDKPPQAGPPACSPEATWSAPSVVTELSTEGADERLLALAPDALTLVFLRDGELFVADRADVAQPFTPLAQALPSDYTADYGAALSPDGLRLILVSQARDELAQLTRAARSEPFGAEPDPAPFLAPNVAAQFSGASLGYPVLSASGDTLLYVSAQNESFVLVSEREASGAWTPGSERLGGALKSEMGEDKLPHAIAADSRTVFFFDERTGAAAGMWRGNVEEAFTNSVELPGRLSAAPVEDCRRLYTTRSGASSLDIMLEEAP